MPTDRVKRIANTDPSRWERMRSQKALTRGFISSFLHLQMRIDYYKDAGRSFASLATLVEFPFHLDAKTASCVSVYPTNLQEIGISGPISRCDSGVLPFNSETRIPPSINNAPIVARTPRRS